MAEPHPGPQGAPAAPESFEAFVEEHYQAAYRFAFSLCGHHHDACDITQQAFYLAYARADQLRDPAKRKPWLFSILHREFLRTWRRENQHPQTPLEFSEAALPLLHVDHAALLDSQTVLQVLGTIDMSFRAPLVLFYLDQLSYKEIAAALELPIGTVMSRLARGKQMLRQRLEGGTARAGGKIVPLPPPAEEGESNG